MSVTCRRPCKHAEKVQRLGFRRTACTLHACESSALRLLSKVTDRESEASTKRVKAEDSSWNRPEGWCAVWSIVLDRANRCEKMQKSCCLAASLFYSHLLSCSPGPAQPWSLLKRRCSKVPVSVACQEMPCHSQESTRDWICCSFGTAINQPTFQSENYKEGSRLCRTCERRTILQMHNVRATLPPSLALLQGSSLAQGSSSQGARAFHNTDLRPGPALALGAGFAQTSEA